MSWDAPEPCWQFLVGDDPPGDLPAAWASATRAVTRDLGCRQHGRSIGFDNVMWKIAADDGSVCVGFALADDADVGAYQRCNSYRLDTTAAQATVWMADDVQYELTGYEFVQWPIAGRRILVPPLADAQWAKQASRTRHYGSAQRLLRPAATAELSARQRLTCPVFITTPEFLPQHREQLELTRGIIERARHRGQLRVAEMNQQTADNLLTIITTLEKPQVATDSDGSDAS